MVIFFLSLVKSSLLILVDFRNYLLWVRLLLWILISFSSPSEALCPVSILLLLHAFHFSLYEAGAVCQPYMEAAKTNYWCVSLHLSLDMEPLSCLYRSCAWFLFIHTSQSKTDAPSNSLPLSSWVASFSISVQPAPSQEHLVVHLTLRNPNLPRV